MSNKRKNTANLNERYGTEKETDTFSLSPLKQRKKLNSVRKY